MSFACALFLVLQGGFLNLGGSIAFALVDTAWVRVTWDGRIDQSTGSRGKGDGVVGSEAASVAPPLLSPGAWEALELELSRDSELRLLIVVMRVRDWLAPREGQRRSGVRVFVGDTRAMTRFLPPWSGTCATRLPQLFVEEEKGFYYNEFYLFHRYFFTAVNVVCL